VSTGAGYFWGFAGGFFAAVFVYVLPMVVQTALTGEHTVTRVRAVAIALVVLFLAAAAGLVPLIPDQVTRGQAISLGLASQAILKGLISGVRDAMPPVLPRHGLSAA
jgi:hypothetical protein